MPGVVTLAVPLGLVDDAKKQYKIYFHVGFHHVLNDSEVATKTN
jgi:hypothetical protein